MNFNTYTQIKTLHSHTGFYVVRTDNFDFHIKRTLSYLQRVEASLQIRPVLVFLSSRGVEFTPPVRELLFLLATYLEVSGRQVNNGAIY